MLCDPVQLEHINQRLASAELLLKSVDKQKYLSHHGDELQDTIASLRHRASTAHKLQRNGPPMWDELTCLEQRVAELSYTTTSTLPLQRASSCRVRCHAITLSPFMGCHSMSVQSQCLNSVYVPHVPLHYHQSLLLQAVKMCTVVLAHLVAELHMCKSVEVD